MLRNRPTTVGLLGSQSQFNVNARAIYNTLNDVTPEVYTVSAIDTLTALEPELSAAIVNNVSYYQPDAGDYVAFTVTVSHGALSTAPAYQVGVGPC